MDLIDMNVTEKETLLSYFFPLIFCNAHMLDTYAE